MPKNKPPRPPQPTRIKDLLSFLLLQLEAYSTTPRQNSTPPRSTSLVSGHLLISDTPFNCDSEGLFQFLREVEDRAIEMGWLDGVLNIPVDGFSHGEEEEDNEENEERNWCTLISLPTTSIEPSP